MAYPIKNTKPYDIIIQWEDQNGQAMESYGDIKMASKVLSELEIQKGIKGKFRLSDGYIQ